MQSSYDRFKFVGMRLANLAALVAVLVTYNAWATKAQAHDDLVNQQIAEAERAASRGPYATDGVFEGEAQGYRGPVRVQVTIDGGYIEQVEIVEAEKEDPAWLKTCSVLPDTIVHAQTSKVDVVSGATFTSAGILNATTDALRKSMGGDAA